MQLLIYLFIMSFIMSFILFFFIVLQYVYIPKIVHFNNRHQNYSVYQHSIIEHR